MTGDPYPWGWTSPPYWPTWTPLQPSYPIKIAPIVRSIIIAENGYVSFWDQKEIFGNEIGTHTRSFASLKELQDWLEEEIGWADPTRKKEL